KKIKKNELEALKININDYVSEDFLKKDYKVLIPHPTEWTGAEQAWDYGRFLNYFKIEIMKELTTYTTRYLSLIPSDLLNTIFKTEDLLATNNAFLDPLV